MDPENNTQQAVESSEPKVSSQPDQTTRLSNTTINEKDTSSIGPLFAIIVILLVIVAGGLYFWLNDASTETQTPPPQVQQEATAEEELNSLEAEFNTEEFNDVENTFDSIDTEFEAST